MELLDRCGNGSGDPKSVWGQDDVSQFSQHYEYQVLATETDAKDLVAKFAQSLRGLTQKVHVISEFKRLKAIWESETVFTSSIHDKSMHEAYQQIIGLGPAVIPAILEELQTVPDFWFWALRALTRENPVKDSHLGDLRLMAKDWIEWGKSEGYIR